MSIDAEDTSRTIYEHREQSVVNTLVIETLRDELSRQSLVISSIYTRITILVGASGISTALLTRVDLPAQWLLPFACFVATIVMAIIALQFPTGATIDPAALISRKNEFSREDTHEAIIHALHEIHDDASQNIQKRQARLFAGMILFGAGWVFSFLILLIESIV